MSLSAHHLTLAACLVLASACGEKSGNSSAVEEPAVSAPDRATPDGALAASASTPITIDKGDGCMVVIQELGSGRGARVGDEVTLDYVARLSDSEIPFASSSSWNEHCRIELGAVEGPRVVAGLARGLEGLKAGSKATITVPPALAYGKAGLPSAGIPADATLVFEVQVSGVRR